MISRRLFNAAIATLPFAERDHCTIKTVGDITEYKLRYKGKFYMGTFQGANSRQHALDTVSHLRSTCHE